MKIVKSMDSGPISNIYEIKLDPRDNAEEISKKLSFLAARNISSDVENILENKAKFIDQDHSKASYAKKIDKTEGQINWNDKALKIIGIIKKRKVKAMEINCLNDITDESLTDLNASVIHDFIQDSLKDASEKFSADKQEKEDALVEANEKYEALTKNHESLKAEIEVLQEKLHSLEEEKIEKENFDKFNQRMATLDEKYDLTEQDRKVLASRLENISDEDFETFNSDISILLSSKIKGTEEENNNVKEVSASAEDVVDQAMENGKVDEASVPVSSPTEEPTLKEKFSKAFTVENFDIKL